MHAYLAGQNNSYNKRIGSLPWVWDDDFVFNASKFQLQYLLFLKDYCLNVSIKGIF